MDFDYLWEGGPVVLKSDGFRLSTDSVLLGNFVNLSGARKGVDLGCASGIISIIAMSLNGSLHMTGIEISPAEAETAGENIKLNGLEDRCDIICVDLRDCREYLQSGSFDVVVANPPYFPVGSGPVSPDEDRARARGEGTCSLNDICRAASYLCRYGGKVAMVHKPERLAELFSAMQEYGIEPKRLRMVCKDTDSPPSLVLVEGRRGGAPSLSIERNLYLFNADGTDTDEVKMIYHRT